MDCLFSIHHLWISMVCAYCMAIIFICLNVLLICDVGSLSFVASSFIEGMWMVALAPDANTISGATFQPRAIISLMSGWYFVIFMSVASVENRSLPLPYVYFVNQTSMQALATRLQCMLSGWIQACMFRNNNNY